MLLLGFDPEPVLITISPTSSDQASGRSLETRPDASLSHLTRSWIMMVTASTVMASAVIPSMTGWPSRCRSQMRKSSRSDRSAVDVDAAKGSFRFPTGAQGGNRNIQIAVCVGRLIPGHRFVRIAVI
jgi:hypothetical protein